MNQSLYFNARLIVASMLLVLGACLLWGIIPRKLQGTLFDFSRKCIGAAIMIMPLSTFLVYFLSLRSHFYNLHLTSYLTACYAISILVTVGFIPLLGGHLHIDDPKFKRRFIRGLIGIPVFAAPMVIANVYCSEQVAEIAKIITVILLLTAMMYQSYVFHVLYHQAIRRGNNYYSDDVEVDISWIIKSALAFFTIDIVCATSTFFPRMGYAAEMLLTVYRVGTLVYVFSQFVKFMNNFETMMIVCENPNIDEVDIESGGTNYKVLSVEQRTQISVRLDKWIAKKGYTVNGVTIDDVAFEVVTNRTYLSLYINTTFGCSFKVWVTSLRVERAKELLRGTETIVDIARTVGFSSPQSFMHSFKRTVGSTPTEWRNLNRK